MSIDFFSSEVNLALECEADVFKFLSTTLANTHNLPYIFKLSHLNLIILFLVAVTPAIRNQWASLKEPAMAVKS